MVTIPKSGKQAIAGCPWTVTFQYFNDAQQTWTGLGTILNTAITANAANDGQVNVQVVTANVDSFCPQKQYKIRVTYSSTQSLIAAGIASDDYTVTIKGASANEITLLSSVRETYTFNIPVSATPMYINPVNSATTNTVKWTGCAITCTLEKLNTATNTWTTFTPTADLAFVTALTNVCQLTINFTTSSTFWTSATAPNLNRLRTIYTFRIGVQYTNVLAATPGVYAVYDDFDLVMQHYCHNDFFTLTAQKADFT